MPWSASDMAKKGARRAAKAAAVANAVLRECLADGGDRKHCEGKAIRLGLYQSNKGAPK